LSEGSLWLILEQIGTEATIQHWHQTHTHKHTHTHE